MNFHAVKDIGMDIIVSCSVLHTFLPPWEAFNDFPNVQKVYKLILYIIGYIAINGRSTVYRSLSTQNGTQPSQASSQSSDTGASEQKP